MFRTGMRQAMPVFRLLPLRNTECVSVPARYAGHSKWSNIKRDKAVADSKQASKITAFLQQFKNVLRDLDAHDIKNQGHPKMVEMYNLAASLQIEKTLVNRVRDRFLNTPDNQFIIEVRSSDGFFVLLDVAASGQFNQTLGIFKRKVKVCGPFEAAVNSALFAFDKKGIVTIPKVDDLPDLDELAIESGAEDWKEVDSLDDRGGKDIELICLDKTESSVKEALQKMNIRTTLVETRYIPSGDLVVLPEAKIESVAESLRRLEECDGVTKIYTNIDFSS